MLRCEIKNPNQLLIFDSSLIDPDEIRKQVVPCTGILVNTPKAPEVVERLSWRRRRREECVKRVRG